MLLPQSGQIDLKKKIISTIFPLLTKLAVLEKNQEEEWRGKNTSPYLTRLGKYGPRHGMPPDDSALLFQASTAELTSVTPA